MGNNDLLLHDTILLISNPRFTSNPCIAFPESLDYVLRALDTQDLVNSRRLYEEIIVRSRSHYRDDPEIRLQRLAAMTFLDAIHRALDVRPRSLAPNAFPPLTRHSFEFLELVLPKRLREEELSDACEMLQRLLGDGAPQWKIYTKTLSTAGWCLLNAFGYVVATAFGRGRNKV